MRNLIAAVLIIVVLAPAFVGAAGQPIRAAARREAMQTTLRSSSTARSGATPSGARRGGSHPLLIGAVIGGSVGAIWGGVSTTCSATPGAIQLDPCGTRAWTEGALIGGAVGAGIGALAGWAFQAYRR